MKKMNLKRNLALATSAFALSAAFVGCTDYNTFTEEEIKRDIYNKHYDEEFVKVFGEPAEDHDWGMKLLAPAGCYGTGVNTRAGATSDNVNVNRNQWCERDNSGYKTADHVLANTIKVPGWPNFDGYYYGNNGSSTYGGKYTHDYVFGSEGLQVQPCGDVTDYEINYVSTWFRTHQNPASIKLHLTDFFIQNISQDNDQLHYYNAKDLGGTTMEQGLPGGYPKSSAQTGPDDNPRSIWWNGDNAKYVNDVVEPGTNTRRTGVGSEIKVQHTEGHLNSNESLNYSVDYLHFKSMTGNDFAVGFTPDEGWTHINNFNYGNSNFDPEDVKDRGFREIKFVHSSGTEDFACRSSMAAQNSWIHDWVLVHLEWEEDGKQRDGYYLGFDFSNTTGDTKIEADGFYSNWIVKITPAFFAKSENTGRVMCEDLGGNYDFDFNDIVFDVAYDASKTQAVICLMAAGGTLPIVAGHNTRYEAHFMLGEENVEKPVNVDAPTGTKRDVAVYRIDATDYLTAGSLDISKIPILVKYKGESGYTNTTDPVKQFGNSALTDEEYNSQYGKPNNPLTTPTGKQIPRKFVTAIGVDWMKELQCIDEGYQKFKQWVKLPTYTYEVDLTDKDGNATVGKATLHWYDDRTKSALLYDGPKDPQINSSDPGVNPVKWESLKTLKLADNTLSLQNYAVDYITIASYSETGDNSIIAQIKNKENNEPVTFAYIVKAPAGEKDAVAQSQVHAMIIPIWLFEENGVQVPYYVKPDGEKIQITETILRAEKSYRVATWQSNFVRSGVDGATTPATDKGQGVDNEGNYTFVSKYGYTKGDLYVQPNGEDAPRYCDYVAFYVLEDINSNPYSTAVWTAAAGTMGNAGTVKKYECYVIF